MDSYTVRKNFPALELFTFKMGLPDVMSMPLRRLRYRSVDHRHSSVFPLDGYRVAFRLLALSGTRAERREGEGAMSVSIGPVLDLSPPFEHPYVATVSTRPPPGLYWSFYWTLVAVIRTLQHPAGLSLPLPLHGHPAAFVSKFGSLTT